jgi:hypothetical protein
LPQDGEDAVVLWRSADYQHNRQLQKRGERIGEALELVTTALSTASEVTAEK